LENAGQLRFIRAVRDLLHGNVAEFNGRFRLEILNSTLNIQVLNHLLLAHIWGDSRQKWGGIGTNHPNELSRILDRNYQTTFLAEFVDGVKGRNFGAEILWV
jgi:hypothetical protein